jgi:hypothetical protein
VCHICLQCVPVRDAADGSVLELDVTEVVADGQKFPDGIGTLSIRHVRISEKVKILKEDTEI